MDGSVYGAGKAGTPFDPVAFIGKPQTLLRLLSWLFAVVVFGCISSQGWIADNNSEKCIYNDDSNACSYAVTISVLAFLTSIVFLIGDAMFAQFSSAKTRRRYVMYDLASSGFFSFLYFISFCYLTNKWAKRSTSPDFGANNARAAIAFSFFSIFSWGSIAFLAFLKYRQGASQAFAPDYEPDPTNVRDSNFSYPGGPDPIGGYQDPPFAPTKLGN